MKIAPWNPPHEDAQSYIEGVIKDALRIMGGSVTDMSFDNAVPNIDEDEERSIIMKNNYMRIADNFDELVTKAFDEYEGRVTDESWKDGDFDFEDIAERKGFLAKASDALSEGDPDSIIASLNEFIDSYYDEVEVAGIDLLGNWSNLLSYPGASNADSSRVTHAERLVVDAVRELTEELCRLIAKDARILQYVEWRELERIVATSLAGIGFDVHLTPPSKDAGKDVIATCCIKGVRHVYYIEIKHWRSGKRVGSSTIYDFVEINANDVTDGGLLISSSGYTSNVYSHLAELSRYNVELGGEKKIVTLCQQFTRRNRSLWQGQSALPRVLFEHTIN